MNRIGFAWRMMGEDDKADVIHFDALQRLTSEGVFQSSPLASFHEAQTHFALLATAATLGWGLKLSRRSAFSIFFDTEMSGRAMDWVANKIGCNMIPCGIII